MLRALGGATAALGAIAVTTGAAALAIAGSAARAVVTPPGERPEEVVLHGVDRASRTVTVSATPETELPGRYSLWFDRGRGHARVGTIVGRGPGVVIRELLSVERGELEAATHARWGAWYYLTPADLRVPFDEVAVATELGPAPAWLIPPARPSTRWIIQVHGRGVTRAEGLRVVPTARTSGWTSLLISYRNDGDAPSSPDGRYGLGDDEWRDVATAIRFARDRGAQQIVLMGWSMGGATVLQTVLRASEARYVDGVILESAAVDWRAVLARQAQRRGLPRAIQTLATRVLTEQWGVRLTGRAAPIDLDRLDATARAAELGVPLLVLHSDDDPDVPIEPILRLVAAAPGDVHLERFTVAGHTRLWNYDPRRFGRAIETWLSRLPEPSDRS
ncbi:alpha/beta hydrolase family protein [Microcella alkaliphila]|uniref:Alpha/beta hydrolase family protein n=1 Tax=Microcella alkaliphila TaxID=279828 RepID=A0A4Q7TTA7_9MICO|nr:alpha/beta hydrolase family protein [Microcella alkaliphila]